MGRFRGPLTRKRPAAWQLAKQLTTLVSDFGGLNIPYHHDGEILRVIMTLKIGDNIVPTDRRNTFLAADNRQPVRMHGIGSAKRFLKEM